MRNPPRIIVSAFMAAFCVIAVQAAEPAGFSYRRVYELLYQFYTLPPADTDHLAFHARVINPAGPAPRQFVMPHDGKRIIVHVDEFGLFRPSMSPQLAQLNPRMIGEPVATSLRLGLAIVIRTPPVNTPVLPWWREGVRQTNVVLGKRARVDADRVPHASGVTLRFLPNANARVVIRKGDDEFVLGADEEGRVDLVIDETLTSVETNVHPQVVFPLFE